MKSEENGDARKLEGKCHLSETMGKKTQQKYKETNQIET